MICIVVSSILKIYPVRVCTAVCEVEQNVQKIDFEPLRGMFSRRKFVKYICHEMLSCEEQLVEILNNR